MEMSRTVLIRIAFCGFAMLALPGCNDGASSRSDIQPSPAPDDANAAMTETKPPDQASKTSTAPDADPSTDTGARPSQPSAQDKPEDKSQNETDEQPKIPDYVTVLERIEDNGPARVSGRVTGTSRLIIDTRNVRRMRISRSKLAFGRGRSIPLEIDGQVFELRASTSVVEMERSRNGEWSPVKKQP
jgi:hypothetical protein